MNPPLSARRIAALALDHASPALLPLAARLELVQETGSTNADLMARLPQLETPVLRVAENQIAGRGRAGRPWHSVPGAALMFSLAWKFQCNLAGLVGLPLAVGVAVADTLARFGLQARLKWPNDILLDGDKLAGVLIETATTGNGPGRAVWAVIGIGINVALPDTLRAQIGRPVAHLAQSIDRDALMAALWQSLETLLGAFEQHGFALSMARWNQLDAYAGQNVTIIDQGQVIHQGRNAGVDDIGRLRLDVDDGERRGTQVLVVAGDVSLRATREA
ncbi:MAG: biotin--[acetyl-CoA-carboxylase] ligase [Janthinobacterium lividum]